jgi:hypothetical protein
MLLLKGGLWFGWSVDPGAAWEFRGLGWVPESVAVLGVWCVQDQGALCAHFRGSPAVHDVGVEEPEAGVAVVTVE